MCIKLIYNIIRRIICIVWVHINEGGRENAAIPSRKPNNGIITVVVIIKYLIIVSLCDGPLVKIHIIVYIF